MNTKESSKPFQSTLQLSADTKEGEQTAFQQPTVSGAISAEGTNRKLKYELAFHLRNEKPT